MAAPEFLSQIPSLEELLENPRIQEAIDRLNKSTAATRVRGALSGLTAEVSRAAESLPGLAPAEWVERLVSRLDLSQPAVPSRVINATGDPFATGCTPPLAPSAVEAMRAAAESTGHIPQTPAAACRLLPCEAAALGASHAAALVVALETLAAGGRVVVARGELHEAGPGIRLDALAMRAGVVLQEVGATDAATPEDFAAALGEPGEGPRLLLSRPIDTPGVDLATLSAIAKEVGCPLVVDLGPAGPTEATPFPGSRPTAEAALRAGAHAVLLDTGGRLGGPTGGLLVGRAGGIEQIVASPVLRAAAADRLIDAAVAATLSLFGQPDTLRFTHPLYQLLDAPVENLRNRAERLAPQLATGPGVSGCEAIELDGSWGVRLQGGAGLAGRLAKAPTPILGREEEPGVAILDLRSVFPRDDRALVAGLAPSAGGSDA